MNSSEMKSVAKELQSITVGAPTHFGGLTIFPLFRNGSAPAEPDYTLLEEAIKPRHSTCYGIAVVGPFEMFDSALALTSESGYAPSCRCGLACGRVGGWQNGFGVSGESPVKSSPCAVCFNGRDGGKP